MTSNSTDAPIKDERFEVMFREAEAYVSGKYNSIYKVDAAISTDTAAKWIAQFALDILDLKTQRVADDHAQLLSETAELRADVERLKRERFDADSRLSQFEGFVHGQACPHGGRCLCEAFAAQHLDGTAASG